MQPIKPQQNTSQMASLIGKTGVSLLKRQQTQSASSLPHVQAWVFDKERAIAFDPKTPTSLIPLDQSKHLQIQRPATTPSILACYLRIQANGHYQTKFCSGIEYYYVIQGTGITKWQDQSIPWQTGDLFCLPGGSHSIHCAEQKDCLLYVLTDQPLARFLNLQSIPAHQSKFQAAHYNRRDIETLQTKLIQDSKDSGVIHFGVNNQITLSSLMPTWKWIIPGEQQTPHRHAAVAIQLFIQGENSHSIIDGKIVKWKPYTVSISPAGSLHSHHNNGEDLGIYLVSQDFVLYKYLRTYWHEEPNSNIYLHDWDVD